VVHQPPRGNAGATCGEAAKRLAYTPGLAAETALLLTLPMPSTAIAADALPVMRGGIVPCLPGLVAAAPGKLGSGKAIAAPAVYLIYQQIGLRKEGTSWQSCPLPAPMSFQMPA